MVLWSVHKILAFRTDAVSTKLSSDFGCSWDCNDLEGSGKWQDGWSEGGGHSIAADEFSPCEFFGGLGVKNC